MPDNVSAASEAVIHAPQQSLRDIAKPVSCPQAFHLKGSFNLRGSPPQRGLRLCRNIGGSNPQLLFSLFSGLISEVDCCLP